MHTDDHILQSFVAAKGPLPTLAVDLGMTFIALVQWIDRNADLIAVAKRAMETHIAFLALRAEAAALVDLTKVSTSTANEERKRKSASQLLRHSAKRLLTAVGAPHTSRNASPPSPRQVRGGEKCLSTEGAKEMRGVPIAPSVDPTSLPNLVASGVSPVPTSSTEVSASSSSSSLDASMPLASVPSSLPNAECPMPNAPSFPNAECPMPSAPSQPSALSFSDREIDVLMVTLARHFNIDITSDDADPKSNTMASSAGPA